ncbi:hypothetical protein BC832DRAFT_191756 [Gaertneriomyces semiglobifer]|nr:hypothetical protein BC832DRAFT_191756 [Gaertneriomyces semiglobifer]
MMPRFQCFPAVNAFYTLPNGKNIVHEQHGKEPKLAWVTSTLKITDPHHHRHPALVVSPTIVSLSLSTMACSGSGLDVAVEPREHLAGAIAAIFTSQVPLTREVSFWNTFNEILNTSDGRTEIGVMVIVELWKRSLIMLCGNMVQDLKGSLGPEEMQFVEKSLRGILYMWRWLAF